LLNEAALHLRALGRLTDALRPMRAGLEMYVEQESWGFAARVASNLSELEVTLGRLTDTVADARQSTTYADQSGNAFLRMGSRTTAADGLHQSGQRDEAGTLFAEAERMQKERQPEFGLLYSLWGFRYCDRHLAPAERAAWQGLLRGTVILPVADFHGQDGHARLLTKLSGALGWPKRSQSRINGSSTSPPTI
jgi:ATP/maltotriose-dependent transcriptional regulator MalT